MRWTGSGIVYKPLVVGYEYLCQQGGQGQNHQHMPVRMKIILLEIVQRLQNRYGQDYLLHNIQDLLRILMIIKNNLIRRI